MKKPFDFNVYLELKTQYFRSPDPIAKHLNRQAFAEYCYRHREDPDLLADCIRYCKEDIAELPILDEYTKAETAARYKELGYAPRGVAAEEIAHGFTGRIVTLERLAIIEKNRGNYEQSKSLYQQLIDRIAWNSREKDEIARLERAIAAIDKKIAAKK
nr:MAG TPA: hypothetical protein [Bacteriophage sp.]